MSELPQGIDWISLLLGSTGGTFAMGAVVGSIITWGLNLKIVSPFVQRAHAAEMQAMMSKINALETRVRELETFESRYMALLEKHSERTLRVPTQIIT